MVKVDLIAALHNHLFFFFLTLHLESCNWSIPNPGNPFTMICDKNLKVINIGTDGMDTRDAGINYVKSPVHDEPAGYILKSRRKIMSEMREPHIVVVGAGFGGLQLIHDLRNVNVQITLIDQRNHHLFQPLLYQVATTILATSEIAWPIRHLFRDRKEVTTLLGTVTDVDTERRQVQLEDGTEISYDTLVLATGARHAYFGNDQWEALAPGLKALEDATTIRRRLLLAFERAERETDEARQQALLTFAIVGGGPTGVELAGIIAELAKQTIWPEFRNIDTRQTRVMLLEAGPRILAAFPEDLSDYALKALEKLGVEVRLGIPVKDITAEGVTVGEEFIPCRTAIWAAGVAASPAATWLNAESDRAGRVKVLSNLNIPGHDDIFVIGDTAWVEGPDGKPVRA